MVNWIKFPILITKVINGTETPTNVENPIQKMSWVMVRSDQIATLRPWREDDMVVTATVITLVNGESFVAETVPSVVERLLDLNVLKIPLTNNLKNTEDEKPDHNSPGG